MSRFTQFPKALAEQSRTVRLAAPGVPDGIPALLAHPDWTSPAPTMIWLHGRTAYKELDPGRYLRWLRAGIATCAIDLPGHGERADLRLQEPSQTLNVLRQAVGEIDHVVEALAGDTYAGAGGEGLFDLDRMGLGGMSAGGMATLRRLCDGHDFACAAVEATTGWLAALYDPSLLGEAAAPKHRWTHAHPSEEIAALDASQHLGGASGIAGGFRPIPLLALHSEADEVVSVAGQRAFVERLRAHYAARGADPALIEFVTWPTTGAPEEHVGFGRVSNEAKNAQTEFLVRKLSGRSTT